MRRLHAKLAAAAARGLLDSAMALNQRGLAREASSVAHRSLPLAPGAMRGEALAIVGYQAEVSGDHQGAIDLYLESFPLLAPGSPRRSWVHVRLGAARGKLDGVVRAEHHPRLGARLARSPSMLAHAQAVLAVLLGRFGRNEEEVVLMRAARATFRELG